MITRRFILALAALLAVAGWAATPASAQADRSAEAAQFIRDLGARAIEVLVNPDLPRQEASRRFEQLLNEGFDVPYIGRFVLGRYWNQATPQQQREYLDLFKQMIIQVYADRFAQYSNQNLKASETLRILGHRPAGDNDAIVSTQIVRPDAPPVAVDWRLRSRDGQWRIIDVVVEGISMSVTQRNEFASVIQRGGGRIEALLDALRSRVGRA